MIPYKDIGSKEKCFFFTSKGMNEFIVFAVERLDRWCVEHAGPTQLIPVSSQLYHYIKLSGGLERSRLNAIEGQIKRPIVCIDTPEETIIIDGNHRCARAFEQGQKEVKGWIIAEFVWRHFTVEMPQHLLPDNVDHAYRGIQLMTTMTANK